MKRKCPLCELNYILNDNDEKCESCMNNKSKNNDCKTRNDKLSNYEIFTKYQQKFEINRNGFLIPNVIILATRSVPYLPRTYSITSWRLESSKSTSKSGADTRSLFKKRSK